MGIKNGKYTIMTVQTGQLVGRELVEDRSFNPKRVVVLDNPIPAVWTVENVDDNMYNLATRGSPTASINNLVFGILTDDPPPTSWNIIAAPRYGPGAHITALTDDQSQGWVAPLGDEETNQISVKGLEGNLGEAFVFAPVEDE